MKNSPGSKRSTPRSAKKQQSILSFFGSNGSKSHPPNPTIQNAVKSLAFKSSSDASTSPSPQSASPSPLKRTQKDLHPLPDERPVNTAKSAPITRHRVKASPKPSRFPNKLFELDDVDVDDEPIPTPRPRKRRVVVEDDDNDSTPNGPHDDEYVPPDSPGSPADHDYPPSPKRKRKSNAAEEDDDALMDQLYDEVMNETSKSVPAGTFDFSTLACPSRQENSDSTQPMETENHVPEQLNELRKRARDKLGAVSTERVTVGCEEKGWCERHPWSADIRDSKKRRPDHPDYDKSTLYIPPNELVGTKGTNKNGLTPFQRQFWKIKKDNYDIIIFFKKGKFYELYDRDADIGHRELNLTFTRGGRVDMRCCGVPEQSFDRHCGRLLDLGYKIGRVEQTESAVALEKRKSGGGGGGSSVCERTLVRILTRGTASEDGLLKDHRARYVFSITETPLMESELDDAGNPIVKHNKQPTNDSPCTIIGICYVDVASGSISISQFDDDYRLSKVERLIACMRPQELIVDTSQSSQALKNLVAWYSRQSDADVCDYAKKDGFPSMTEDWLRKYMKDKEDESRSNNTFKRVCQYMKKFGVSTRAFGAMANYLKSLIIDEETLSLGNYVLFPDLDGNEEGNVVSANSNNILNLSSHRLRMDAPTLQNLEVLTNSVDASEKGALLQFVDRATTAPGRRLIRKWLTEPLQSAFDIEERLSAIDAIHEIEDADGGGTLKSILSSFKTRRDLERALPKLHRHATKHDAAVMFDDTNKRRVREFIAVLKGLNSSLIGVQQLKKALSETKAKSRRLDWLCTEGAGIPKEALEKLSYFLDDAFNVKESEETGEILPKPGAVPSYDEASKSLDDIEEDLQQELQKWKKKLQDNTIKFFHRGKEPYQLEVKVQNLRGEPSHELQLTSETKSCKRFHTRQIKNLIRLQAQGKETLENVASGVVKQIVRDFDQYYRTWYAIIATCAEIDALIGLSMASRDNGFGPMCRPTVLPNDHPHPLLKAEQLRHPILSVTSENFVANDISLGTDGNPEVMVLTGPNAGGKSTLSRQIAVSVILAQIGCYVPAQSFKFRPFRDIYVRMGACDDIARGRSTFMVEMEEVGNILNCASPYSLVIADEVGRGTSTHDGFAVAYAALDHIARENRSLTVFSTHYSHLADDLVNCDPSENRAAVGLYEMAAKVDEATKNITFLYKLQPGSSGHSRGIYCARVAGIPSETADDAEKASAVFDMDLERRLIANGFLNICNALDKATPDVDLQRLV